MAMNIDGLMAKASGSGRLNPALLSAVLGHKDTIAARHMPLPAKMPRGGQKYAVFVIDNTGSMLRTVRGSGQTQAAMEMEALNSALEVLKGGSNPDACFVLFELVVENPAFCRQYFGQDTPVWRPVKGMPPLTVDDPTIQLLFNGSSTPLPDAIYRGLTSGLAQVEQVVQSGTAQASLFLYVMTDGETNQIIKNDQADVKAFLASANREMQRYRFRGISADGSDRVFKAEGEAMGFTDIKVMSADPQALIADLREFSKSVSAAR